MNASESFVPLALNRTAGPTGKTADRGDFVPAKAAPTEASPRTGTPSPGGAASHAGSPSASVVAPRPHGDHGRPVVTLRREGDQVTGIRIECTCGKVIELDCLY